MWCFRFYSYSASGLGCRTSSTTIKSRFDQQKRGGTRWNSGGVVRYGNYNNDPPKKILQHARSGCCGELSIAFIYTAVPVQKYTATMPISSCPNIHGDILPVAFTVSCPPAIQSSVQREPRRMLHCCVATHGRAMLWCFIL